MAPKSVGKSIPDVDRLGAIKFLPAFVLGPLVWSMICAPAAHFIYKNGNTELFEKNIARMVDNEQGYTLLAAVLFNLVVVWVNSYPMLYKSMVMRFSSGNLRANMQIYKAAGGSAESPYVILETSGPVGKYNRANRSLTHLVENSIPVALFIPLCGSIFPLPTLQLTAAFGLGRVLHQIGYASIGYGAHAPGFVLAEFAKFTMQMLCVLAADKSLALGWFQAAAIALKMEL